jgi:hypothetical protein
MEISINTKTRLQVMTWSLVFMLKLISTFIGQNKEFFHARVEEGCSASLCIVHEKKT